MTERSPRGELLSWPDPLPEGGDGERSDADWDGPTDPGARLARAAAALVAARNEIALLRARVARLQRDNERLEIELAERRPRKPS